VARTGVIAERFFLIEACALVAIHVGDIVCELGREGGLNLAFTSAGAMWVEDLWVHVLGVYGPRLFAACAVNISTEVFIERGTVIAESEVSWCWSELDFGFASAGS